MPFLALLALLTAGAGGVYIGKKLEDDKAATSQAECFKLARQGKIDPRLCAKMGEGSLAALADVAEEVTAFTRSQILVQSSTALLAQANAVPQNALTLLQ